MSVPASNGVYQIVNVQYSPQTADLLYGNAASSIGGFYSTSPVKTNQWSLTNVYGLPGGPFTLANVQVTTYAQINSANSDEQLVGSTTAPPVEWAMDPTDADNQYVIFAFNSPGKVWTLSNGDNYTVITLETRAEPQDNSQVWSFVPVN